MASKEEVTPKPDFADLPKPTAAPHPEPEAPQFSKTKDIKLAAPVVNTVENDSFYLHTKPKVVECTWEQFKNRFQNADKPSFDIATVELLMTSETLDEDIEVERLVRMDKERREKYLAGHRRPTQPRHAAIWTSGLQFERIRINSTNVNRYLARASGNRPWPAEPHTFLIPFAFLIHHQEMMQTELKKLNDRLFGLSHAGERDAGVTFQLSQRPLKLEDFLEEEMVSENAYLQMKCYVEFVDAKLIPHYKQFEESNHSNPKKIRFDDLWCLFRYGELLCRPNNSTAVRRHDHAALFSPYFNGGDDLRTLSHGPSRGPSASVDTHTVIRAKGINIPSYKWDVSVSDEPDDDHRRRTFREPVGMEGFYIDYDGFKFAPVSTYIEIEFFRGEMEVHKLPIFPIRFLQNEETFFVQLRDRGRQFHNLVTKAGGGREAFEYDGWSRTTTPLGKPISMIRQAESSSWMESTMRESLRDVFGVGSAVEVQPEYISSTIIVDFQEAYQNIPAWRPNFDISKSRVDTMPDMLYDSFPIMCWADDSREKEATAKVRELVVADDRVASVLWNNLLQTDPFSSSEPDDNTRAENQVFSDHDLVMLPSRIMAYALRDRKFFNADVSSVREIHWPSDEKSPFNSLMIDPKRKNMILSIVHEHFENKTLAGQLQHLAASSGGNDGDSKNLELTLPDQDFIRGKGKGLVILLHGAPGVGKTATAEAVALSRRRPLFLITCGDLGTTPESVEGGLKQIFRLANLWDCILLLDEADIFLSQREKGNESITRNAMVSIFLRTLEYYPGILFLTTNRPGVFDEAVKSRVHVSLDYPAFSLEQTLELFRMNIERLEEIEKVRFKAQRASQGPGPARQMMTIRKDEIMKFAEKHYNGDQALRWNGRQIRNAFQIAASLARFQQQQQHQERAPEEAGRNGAAAPYIGKEHFKQVANATANFDKMRRDLHKMSDNELAFQRTERAHDGAHPNNESPYQVGRDEPPRGARAYNKGSRRRNEWGDRGRDDTGGGRRGHSDHYHRGAPVQRRSRYYDDDDDDDDDYGGYQGNSASQFDDRTYGPDRYHGDGGGYGRGGGGGVYAGDGSVGPPWRGGGGRHRNRDRSPYQRGREHERDRDYDRGSGRRGGRAWSVSSFPGVSRSRSRSSSGSEAEAQHGHNAPGSNTKQRQATKASGRRPGEKSITGEDSSKYGRRRAE